MFIFLGIYKVLSRDSKAPTTFTITNKQLLYNSVTLNVTRWYIQLNSSSSVLTAPLPRN